MLLSSCSMSAQELPTRMFPSGTRILLECARTSLLYSSVTKLMSRTERSRQSKSLSTERRTSNTTIFPPSQTINLKNPSFGSLEDSSGKFLTFLYQKPNFIHIVIPTWLLLKLQFSSPLKLQLTLTTSKIWTKSSRTLLKWNSLKVKMTTSEQHLLP